MKFFNRKKTGNYSVLTETYVPALLPTYGQKQENIVTADYPMNNPETVKKAYREAEKYLSNVIATCDHHSAGTECDHYIDAAIEHTYAAHKAVIANNENQVVRIRSAREMRKAALGREIASVEENIEKLKAEIEPLEGLRSQFQVRIGKIRFSLGSLITVAAMILDGLVNYNFLQSLILSNAALLMITVSCMSVMSDASMWALATFLSRRNEKFISKPLFWTVCIGMGSLFILSVVTSVMIRWGSMDATFGTINAAGEFVGKESYSLAEYGITLVTAFLTTATGLLSFGFSLDENGFAVSVRERKKKELNKYQYELDAMLNELALLKNAPDPQKWDEEKCAAAVHQIEATRIGLKDHCRKQMTLRANNPDFTEKMAESGAALLSKASAEDVSITPTIVTLNKAS